MTPVTPLPASTVILVRPGEPVGQPWQCFMVRRHAKSDFAADVFVFPGGKVDESDRREDCARHTVGHPGPGETAQENANPWRALRLAAIRELFEEAGVLLAQRPDEGLLRLDDPEAERFADYREQLRTGRLALVELAQQEGLVFPLDRLHAISRWITPESFPRRFDTWFFVASVPHGQQPLHDAHETTAGVWIEPGEALDRFRQGSFPLVFATEKHLERLARSPSIESLLATTTPGTLQPVIPKVIEVEGEMRFLLPGDRGY